MVPSVSVKMKTFICLVVLAASIAVQNAKPTIQNSSQESDQGNGRFVHVENELGEIELIDLYEQPITYTATLKDVSYYLYTRANRNSPHVITNGDVNKLRETPFNPSRKNLFITHGWNNNFQSGVNTLITAAALDNYDLNVFVVDWRNPANSNYLTAKNAVTTVGNFQGQFINAIQNAYHLTGSSFVLVGHSLGAHVAGNAGAVIGSKVDHIVGLDPASPLFTISNTANRLDPTDANFVEIIHTDGRELGFASSIGHADYFPNGGKSQPGCGADLTGKCSHEKSYKYFAESLNPRYRYSAYLCGSYKDFQNEKCTRNRVGLMGQFNVDRAQGNFYLDTNANAPFARG